jgi:hypothetical protein
MLANFSTIIIKDFNIKMLTNTLELITLQYYMNNQFKNIYTNVKPLITHK